MGRTKIAPVLRDEWGRFDSRRDASHRFEASFTRSDRCWTWIGGTGDHGYGRFWFGGSMWQAHRFAWHLYRGPLPGGVVVCHRCDNPACVNPDHLFIGTQSDNMRDCAEKGRIARVGRPRVETHCRHGHPFTAENTIVEPGQRRCRECKNARLRLDRALARLERASKGDGHA